MKDARTVPQILCLPLKPIFPFLRNISISCGIFRPHIEGRGRFLVGYKKEDLTTNDFLKTLKSRGFFHQTMAYDEPGQLLSLRKLDPTQLDHQYHVRLFNDGEVRAHYEKTPEDHPRDHLAEVGLVARREEFLEVLSGLISESTDDETPETPGHTSL